MKRSITTSRTTCLNPGGDDYRLVLRVQTRKAHDRLDHLISSLDITSIAGFERFCKIHITMFEALAPFDRSPATSELIAALQRDIAAVSTDDVCVSSLAMRPLHPLAVAYIVEGSRMGTQVLQKRWAAATDPKIKAANAYFGLVPTPDRWRDVCDRLRRVPNASEQAEKITQDVLEIFNSFTKRYLELSPKNPIETALSSR